jgi:glycine hydroxymethyltransferase
MSIILPQHDIIGLFDLTNKEKERQKNTLNLIASENYPSKEVLELQGSVWQNKYGEGYPGKRYYAGNEYTDELENMCKQYALGALNVPGGYDGYNVNVQVLSGTPANLMVYLSCLEYGDTVMRISLNDGGHLSHIHSMSPLNKLYKTETLNLEYVNSGYQLDLNKYEEQIKLIKPKLVILGFSAYPRSIDFAPFIKIAHQNNARVLCDIAHIAGLVATGLHPTPFIDGINGADYITTTTHKTLRGPRGALLFMKKEHEAEINKTIFPGMSGGPHFHQIAATTRAMEEILGYAKHPDTRSHKDYITSVINNTKELENGLLDSGIEIVTPSENHLLLAKLPQNIDSLATQIKLEKLGIITNRNAIPNETKTAWRPSGLRLGAAALTSRGLTSEDSLILGKLIGKSILHNSDDELFDFTKTVLTKLSWWY